MSALVGIDRSCDLPRASIDEVMGTLNAEAGFGGFGTTAIVLLVFTVPDGESETNQYGPDPRAAEE